MAHWSRSNASRPRHQEQPRPCLRPCGVSLVLVRLRLAISLGARPQAPRRPAFTGGSPSARPAPVLFIPGFREDPRMMIVMKPEATEDEIQAVIARIESVGAKAHPSRGEEVTVIGADRRPGTRRPPRPRGGARRLPARPDPQALQAGLPRPAARQPVGAGDRRAADRRRQLRADRRSVHGGVPRPDARHRRRGGRGGRGDVPRRCLQAAHVAVRVPGAGAGGAATAGRGQGAHRPADRHRADGHSGHRRRGRGRRRGADRRAQHAELLAALGGRPVRHPRPDQARAVEHARGAADGRRVRPQGGQRERSCSASAASARSRPPTGSRWT